MSYTQRFSEVHAPLIIENADAFAAATYNSAWVNHGTYHRGVLELNVGDMAQGATLDVLLQEAQDAAGTGAGNIAGKAITQLTQAGGDGNDYIVIELRTAELDVNNGYEFVRVQVVVANAQVELGYVYHGIIPRFAPVPVANYTEIVD